MMLKIAYDGTGYHGWQEIPGQPEESIEGRLNLALSALLPEERPRVTGASRTDAGVHALGNVAVFDTESRIPADRFARAINRFLPEDIRITAAEECAADFHPRFTPHRKVYEYHIDHRWIPDPMKRLYSYNCSFVLDLQKMKAAAEYLEGEHDFTSFVNPDSQVLLHGGDAVRRIFRIRIHADGEEVLCQAQKDEARNRNLKSEEGPQDLIITFEGNGFLYHMIRILVGTLLQVGTGKRRPEDMLSVLEARDRRAAGMTVPARGLWLRELDYGTEKRKEIRKEIETQNMQKPIRGVILDMDGTILDTERLYHRFWFELSKTRGFKITDEMLDRMRGACSAVSGAVFEAENPEFSYLEEKKRRAAMVREWCDTHGVPVKPGARELLRYLKSAGFRIALGSSSPVEMITFYLERAELMDVFDFIGSGEMVTKGKPSPELFLLCAEKLGLEPRETVVVEDSVNGLQAGRAAGAWVAAVPDMNDLSEAGDCIDIRLERLDDLIPWLDSRKAPEG